MRTFFKANVASLVASGSDFLVTFLVVQFIYKGPVTASIIGTTCGGIINFLIGRYWAFKAKEKNGYSQALKYFVVWIGNLLLNAGGVHLLANILSVQYMIAKITTSLVVSLAYNYPLQKWFVFEKK